MRRADVPTQRRPRHRQVSQGMREGKGRTTADATSVGVGAIEVLHPSPGPPSPTQNPTNKMPTQIPQPNNPPPPLSVIPAEAGIHPSGKITHNPAVHPIPGPLPSTELEAEVGAEAPTSASVLLSPSPSMALRERGIKGVRVPFPSPAPREIPRRPFRRHSIKTATSSINVQSKPHNRIRTRLAAGPPNECAKLTPPTPEYRIRAAFGGNHYQSCASARAIPPLVRHAPITAGGR